VLPVFTPETLIDTAPLMVRAAMNTPALELSDIRKRFGRLTVLDGVTATVASGRVTAIVGPNASGKSTLIKCVLAWSGRIPERSRFLASAPGATRAIAGASGSCRRALHSRRT
jgi:ABC-type phosphate/phosphonate transport system ATPase subunit